MGACILSAGYLLYCTPLEHYAGSGRSASQPPTAGAAKSCGEMASNDRIRPTGAARGRVRLIWCSIEKQPVARCADERPACDSGLGSRRDRLAA